MKILQKHILEIRFTPTPSIVDKRGVIAESLVGELLNGWSIGNNRINFTNKENKIAALLSVLQILCETTI